MALPYRIALFGPLLVLLGCMGRLGPKSPIPSSMGEHAVGVTTIEVVDAVRQRTLTVEIWYPAARANPRLDPVVYEVHAMGGTVARLRSPTRAHRDVVAWRAGGPRPVILMSHGAGSNRFANESLSEVLASHGYIVAAPDHNGHTTSDEVWGISEDERAQSAYDRPLDLSRVLDELERFSKDREQLLGGVVDMDRVAVAGHSFGGRTALAMVGARFDVRRQERECTGNEGEPLCHALPVFAPHARPEGYRYRDARVRAAFLIAPSGFEFYRTDGIASVDAPVLVVGTKLDRNTPFAERHRPIFDALRTKHYMLTLEDAGHLTPTDVCQIIDSIGFLAHTFGGDDAKDGCGDGYMPNGRALELVSNAAVAFFDVYLNDDPGAVARLGAALKAPERRSIASRDSKHSPDAL